MDNQNNTSLSPKGDLIIFHAGSLSVPFKEISKQFEAENPRVNVKLEAAGSVECARKIVELHKHCDLFASSDYRVIENYLIPQYTGWHIPFASNEMVVAYTEKSGRAGEISTDNWTETLLKPEIRFARSDPDTDPCGYRTIMVFELAEKYYGKPGLTRQLMGKDTRYIRPKETDLLALLEVGEIDYIFIYRSVAIQHQLKYLEIPAGINLSAQEFSGNYQQASVKIPGDHPGDTVTVYGEPMVYSVTMLDKAPNKRAALAFLEFLLEKEKGMKVIESMGQNKVIPAKSKYYRWIPQELKSFVSEK